jgi:DNA replication protein DnaC
MATESIFQSPRTAIMYAGKIFDEDFNLDDDTRLLNYRKAFHCLSNSPLAPTLGMDPDKSLLIIGQKGVGKTLMMRVLQRLFKDTERRFKMVTCMDIFDFLRANIWGEETVEVIKEMYGRGYKGDLFIDDIGLEKVDFKRYGDQINIIGELLYDRYELYTNDTNKFRTHLTSNVARRNTQDPTARTLETLYGDRVSDRIKQMSNKIIWKGESLR